MELGGQSGKRIVTSFLVILVLYYLIFLKTALLVLYLLKLIKEANVYFVLKSCTSLFVLIVAFPGTGELKCVIFTVRCLFL